MLSKLVRPEEILPARPARIVLRVFMDRFMLFQQLPRGENLQAKIALVLVSVLPLVDVEYRRFPEGFIAKVAREDLFHVVKTADVVEMIVFVVKRQLALEAVQRMFVFQVELPVEIEAGFREEDVVADFAVEHH